MWNKIVSVLSLTATLLLSACSSETKFAYKTFDMDTYRTLGRDFEFPADKPFDWVCRLGKNPGERVTVIIQAKELVWVDVTKESQNFNKSDPFVHGHIEGLDPGEYRIVLVGGNSAKAAAEFEFRLFDSAYPEKDDNEDD
jgi:hypothetical protein